MLDFLLELFLELIQEGCFHLIRRYVRCRILRGILYVLTVVAVLTLGFAIVIGVFWLGCQAILMILDGLEALFA